MRAPQSDVEGHDCDRQDNPALIAQPQHYLEHGCGRHNLSGLGRDGLRKQPHLQ